MSYYVVVECRLDPLFVWSVGLTSEGRYMISVDWIGAVFSLFNRLSVRLEGQLVLSALSIHIVDMSFKGWTRT